MIEKGVNESEKVKKKYISTSPKDKTMWDNALGVTGREGDEDVREEVGYRDAVRKKNSIQYNAKEIIK